jgi:hypothetical protein
MKSPINNRFLGFVRIFVRHDFLGWSAKAHAGRGGVGIVLEIACGKVMPKV